MRVFFPGSIALLALIAGPAMSADLGVKAGRMELWVVVIPDSPLMDTSERRKKLENDVYDLYPVQKVNFTYHAPVPMISRTAPPTTMRPLLLETIRLARRSRRRAA